MTERATGPLPPGASLGILGGGQLGRMLAMAAARLGYHAHAYDPAPGSPAFEVCAAHACAPWDDAEALRAFAQGVDVVTFEFENVPPEALDVIEALAPIRPGRRSLATSRDRLQEKEFLRGLGLAVAPFAAVDRPGDVERAVAAVGLPAILKSRTGGYDGRGQARVNDLPGALAAAEALGAPGVLEGLVAFEREASVIAARGLDGSVAAFDPGENVHAEGILRTTTVPARLSPSQRSDAVLIAARVLTALDHVGVLGVELFVTREGGLLVNEIAPRVHNTGHWTQAGCLVDQFEQHVRAVAGLPLGDGSRHADVVMENLIGDDVARLPALLAERAQVHLYGKAPRAGRKMGHVNRLRPPG